MIDENPEYSGKTGVIEQIAGIGKETEIKLYLTALRILGSSEDAEDAVGDGMLAALMNADNYQERGKLEAWLCSCVRSKAINIYRQNKKRKTRSFHISDVWRTSSGEDDESDFFTDTRTPASDEEVQRRDRSSTLQSAICELPVEYRMPVLLHYFSGRSYRKMGKKMGMKHHVVARKMMHALERLKSSKLVRQLV